MTAGGTQPRALLRPAAVCQALLAALEASEGRRKRRQRDTTPDTIGLAIKQALLERAVADDPEPDAFEAWLLERCLDDAGAHGVGSLRAMALEIFTEWQLARTAAAFEQWLAHGAPSDDKS